MDKPMAYFISNEREVKRFFVIFYIVGIIGMVFPFTFPIFTKLVPFTLLLNLLLLGYFHPHKKPVKALIIFTAIVITGFIVEVIGVNTAILFGEYQYGSSLGIKLFETPVIIGLNWLLLTYLTASVFENVKLPDYVKVLLSALVMLGYDVVLEQVAPVLGMWYWANNIVPMRNYLMWFLMALLFHSLLKMFGVKTSNPLSVVVLVSQFVFFVILYFFLR